MAADKKSLLRDALKQVQGGKVDKAIETYKAVAKLDPRDATVHNTLGDLYIKQGRKKEAIAEYLEASNLYEHDGFAMRSIAICQKVANLDPTMLSVRTKLGDLYAGLKLPAEARTQYLMVADASDKKGDVATALEIFRKLADLDPTNLQARIRLAGMFEKKKLPDKAAEEYVRAAKGYFEKKDLNTAAQLCVRAFKISPSNTEARRWLADHYAQRQEWSVVVGLLETPVAKGSRDIDLLLLYGEALTRVNHPREAVKVLERALEREPNSVPVSLGLGRAWLKAGELEKGKAALGRCVAAHLTENRLDAAEALLREMAAAAPGDDAVFQRLLEVAQKRGDKAAVAKATFQLVEIYEKKSLVRSAAGVLEKYLEANPGDAAARARLDALKAQTPAPKVEAPPPAAAPAPAAPAPAPPAAARQEPKPAPKPEPKAEPKPEPKAPVRAPAVPGVDGVELDLEREDFAKAPPAEEEEEVTEVPALGLPEEEEELVLEVEGGEAPAAAEPTTVAEALSLVDGGAAEKAREFLEEYLGEHPAAVDAWEALVSARRQLGDRVGVHNAFLRLADLHRRSQRFDEARAAYQGALGVNPKSAAAAKGLADLTVEEAQAEPAPLPEMPPVGRTAAPKEEEEEEFTLDFSDELEEAAELPALEEDEQEQTGPAAPAPLAAAAAPPEELTLEPAEDLPVIEEPVEELPAIEEPREEQTLAGEPRDESAIAEEPPEELTLVEEPSVELPAVGGPPEQTPEPGAGEPDLGIPGLDEAGEPPAVAEQDFAFDLLEERAEAEAALPVEAADREFTFDFTKEAEQAPPPPVPEAVSLADAGGVDFGDLTEFDRFFSPAPPVAAPAAAPAEQVEAAAAAPVEAPPEAPAEARSEPAAAAEPAPAQGREELDEFMAEADFYLQQGLLDEAEFLYTKLQRLAPDNAEVAAQLLKIQEMRGPEAAVPAPAVGEEAAPGSPGLGEAPGFEEAIDLAFASAAPAVASPQSPPEAEVGATPSLASEAPVEPVSEEPAPESDGGAGDFAQFLKELESSVDLGEPAAPPPEQGEEGLTEIFQEFQRSVKEQLGDEDFETHYNLGIAYKEMGLMEEAVGEFGLAEKSPTRRLDAVSMVALCLREMGRFDEAAMKLRTGVSLATEGSDQQKGFLYDLAGLHEQAGRTAEAQEALRRLAGLDGGYRDVAARLASAQPAVPDAPPKPKKSKVSYL